MEMKNEKQFINKLTIDLLFWL